MIAAGVLGLVASLRWTSSTAEGSTWLVFWGNWRYRPTPARRKPSAKLHSQKFGKNVVKNRKTAHLRDVPIRTRLLCCPRWEPGATCRVEAKNSVP
jgi:hypothetical protein